MNKVLFLPLTTDKGKGTKEPSLEPVECDIFDCCAFYIKEDYEDWDDETKKRKHKRRVSKIIE